MAVLPTAKRYFFKRYWNWNQADHTNQENVILPFISCVILSRMLRQVSL